MKNDTVPGYSVFSAEMVDVSPAFIESKEFVIGRFAVQSDRLPQAIEANGARVMMGAASGTYVEDVKSRAFAEFVERISGFMSGLEAEKVAYKTLAELKRTSTEFIDLDAVVSSEAQSMASFFPDAILEMPLGWCKGYVLRTLQEILVPAQASFLIWQRPDNEPRFLISTASGLAAHTNREDAISHAILEVIERDSLMLSWRVHNWPVAAILSSLIPKDLINIYQSINLQLELYSLGFPDSIQTVLAILYSSNYSMLTCGSACGNINASTISRAIYEALMLQWTIRYSSPVKNWLKSNSPYYKLPKLTMEYIIHAFYNGKAVVDWYHKQCTYPDISQYTHTIPHLWGDFVKVVESAMGQIVIVDVADRMAHEEGWFVYRAIIPKAFPLDCLGVRLDDPRLEEARKKVDSIHLPLNAIPRPFG